MVFEPTLETEQRGSPTKPACRSSDHSSRYSSLVLPQKLGVSCQLKTAPLLPCCGFGVSTRYLPCQRDTGCQPCQRDTGCQPCQSDKGCQPCQRDTRCQPCQRGTCRVNAVPAVSTWYLPCQRGASRVTAIRGASRVNAVPAVSTRYLPCPEQGQSRRRSWLPEEAGHGETRDARGPAMHTT